jgi:sugar lactone lactonase YvrE
MKIRALAEGLGFPEGPVALAPARRSEASPVGMARAELAPEDGSVLLVAGVGGYQRFDSLALDAEGRICVATLVNGGITVISPDGRHVEHHRCPIL